jgi:ribonuclease HI
MIGDKTNIEAEGFAILASIKQHKKTGKKECEIRTDSNFWARAIQFRWKLKEQRLFPLRDLIYNQVDKFKPKVIWIPREQNPAGQYLEDSLKKRTKEEKHQQKLITCPHCGKPITTSYKQSDALKA